MLELMPLFLCKILENRLLINIFHDFFAKIQVEFLLEYRLYFWI